MTDTQTAKATTFRRAISVTALPSSPVPQPESARP